jgi:membrane protein required for beta-lactamase induction
LLAFVFSIFVLSMCLGPADPIRQAQMYATALEQGDDAAANARAADFLGRSVSEDPQLTAQTIKEQLFVRLCVNILGVFFWFIVLGPVGAALFRASCLLQERYEGTSGGLAHAIRELFDILLWLPARLTVLSFSVVGNFVDTAHSLRNFSDLWRRDSRELLSTAGLGAIHIPDQGEDGHIDLEHMAHTIALVKRTVLAWITAFSLIIILIGLIGIANWISG